MKGQRENDNGYTTKGEEGKDELYEERGKPTRKIRERVRAGKKERNGKE